MEQFSQTQDSTLGHVHIPFSEIFDTRHVSNWEMIWSLGSFKTEHFWGSTDIHTRWDETNDIDISEAKRECPYKVR